MLPATIYYDLHLITRFDFRRLKLVLLRVTLKEQQSMQFCFNNDAKNQTQHLSN